MTLLANDTHYFLTPNTTLTSGITKVDTTQSIVTDYQEYGATGVGLHHSKLTTTSLLKAISADAALGFGEHIASFPLGRIQVLSSQIKLISTCASGLSATAGEVGLGTTIASGAIATLGAGAAAMENIMEGTTIADHVTAVTLTSNKGNGPVTPGTTATDGGRILDGSSSAAKIHLNLASTWNQTAAESVTFQAVIELFWLYLGTGS